MSPLTSHRPHRRRHRPETQEVSELDFSEETQIDLSADDEESDAPLRRSLGSDDAFAADRLSADDMAPETLIDEDDPDSPIRDDAHPADATLREVSARELFADPLASGEALDRSA
jgi:hypothetical protein